MTIQDMEYNFKLKLNKIDSQQSVNYRIPEIDRLLNIGMRIFVSNIANPRLPDTALFGVEISQRNIDDLSPLVVNDVVLTPVNNIAPLPSDYMHHLSSYCNVTKGNCSNKIRTTIMQHDDDEDDIMFQSSYNFEQVNIRFTNQGIKVFVTDFTLDNVILDYIKEPLYIYNASSFGQGQYVLPDGTALTGIQQPELGPNACEQIVNIAVDVAKGIITEDGRKIPSTLYDNI